MPIKLYKLDGSPPARAAMMACEIFNVPVEMIDVDVMKGDNHSPEYLKKNPVHSIPVLVEDDFIIHDSHAILTYLADAFGKNDSFYPKDLKKRTEVNQKLFFDTAILFPRLRNVTYPVLVEGMKGPTEKHLKEIEEAYGFLEEFLSRSKFIAGNNVTIADLSAIADVTSLVHILPLNVTKFPKVEAWIETMEKLPYCKKYNAPGAELLGKLYISKYPVLVEGMKGPTEKHLKEIEEAYGFLEEFLSRSKFIAGNNVTIADLSAIADVTSLVHILPLNVTKFPKVEAWIETMENLPYCKKYNAPGAELLGKLYISKVGLHQG